MWRSRWRCVIKPAYSVPFLLSINIFVWQNVLYFPNDLRRFSTYVFYFIHLNTFSWEGLLRIHQTFRGVHGTKKSWRTPDTDDYLWTNHTYRRTQNTRKLTLRCWHSLLKPIPIDANNLPVLSELITFKITVKLIVLLTLSYLWLSSRLQKHDVIHSHK